MPLHMVKMLVGVRDPAAWAENIEARNPGHRALMVSTKNVPKRAAELLDGGSLYWVCGGSTVFRQPLLDVSEEGEGKERRAVLTLGCPPVSVRPKPYRAFQGWRYIEAAAAPADWGDGDGQAVVDAGMPEEMRRKLASLGLL